MEMDQAPSSVIALPEITGKADFSGNKFDACYVTRERFYQFAVIMIKILFAYRKIYAIIWV
ncbi:MAG TPA: hypothetical protein DEQ02_05825 [Ruminococcaceae bacterium]|nr:hypothetical protein [Oscillospiraceae bacterium]